MNHCRSQLRPTAPALTRTMATSSRAHSPSTPPNAADEPSAKRVRLSSPSPPVAPAAVPATTTAPVASTSALPYGMGLHLAPMVRIGTLPTRLLGASLFGGGWRSMELMPGATALEYGAELVWGPEIVDKAIIGSVREVCRTCFLPPSRAAVDSPPLPARTGTIKFIKKGRSIFECHPFEKSRLIFQLGSADPALAVEAALLVAGDVAGVGLNCGCPKPFSLSGGMGAALLKVPDKLCAVRLPSSPPSSSAETSRTDPPKPRHLPPRPHRRQDPSPPDTGGHPLPRLPVA